jgi:hypothetical protein
MTGSRSPAPSTVNCPRPGVAAAALHPKRDWNPHTAVRRAEIGLPRMPLDPQAQKFLEMLGDPPPLDTISPEQNRAAMAAAISLTGRGPNWPTSRT